MILSGKLSQAVRPATNMKGVGCILLYDQCTNTGQPVADILQEKHPNMHVPPVENPMCAAFDSYK